jgi:Secretin and TonB N terminus short domain
MHKTVYTPLRPWRRPSLPALSLAAWRSAKAQEPSLGTMALDLPAGPLAAALLGIGRSAGVLVSFKPGLVGPHQAPALRGRYTLQQALALALQSSGLSFQITPSGVVTVVDRPGHAP